MLALRTKIAEFGCKIDGPGSAAAVPGIAAENKGTGSSFIQLVWDVGNYFKHGTSGRRE